MWRSGDEDRDDVCWSVRDDAVCVVAWCLDSDGSTKYKTTVRQIFLYISAAVNCNSSNATQLASRGNNSVPGPK